MRDPHFRPNTGGKSTAILMAEKKKKTRWDQMPSREGSSVFVNTPVFLNTYST